MRELESIGDNAIVPLLFLAELGELALIGKNALLSLGFLVEQGPTRGLAPIGELVSTGKLVSTVELALAGDNAVVPLSFLGVLNPFFLASISLTFCFKVAMSNVQIFT